MSNRRGPLADLANLVRANSPLPVFSMKGGSPSEAIVIWEGSNVQTFLEFSKRVGARAIYLNESVVTQGNDGEDNPPHVGETESVEVAFLLDGVFHIFVETASWVRSDEEGKEVQPDEATRLETALKSRRPELVSEFLSGYRGRAGSVHASKYAVESGLRDFLAAKFSAPSLRRHFLTPDGANDSLAALMENISEEVSTILIAEDRAQAESKVDDLVKWSRNLGIKSLSKSDVEAFLLERGITLGGEGERLLWTKAKLAVKTGR